MRAQLLHLVLVLVVPACASPGDTMRAGTSNCAPTSADDLRVLEAAPPAPTCSASNGGDRL